MKISAWRLRAQLICVKDPESQQPASPLWLESVNTQQTDSLDALTQILPGGAYTTLRTFDGSRVLHLEDHFKRLESTAAMVDKPVELHRDRLRQAMMVALCLAYSLYPQIDNEAQQPETLPRESQDQSPILVTPELIKELRSQSDWAYGDFRLRLTLDLQDKTGDLYLAFQPLKIPPQEAYQNGVAVMTYPMQRWLPKAKLTRFIQRSGGVRQAMLPGIHETIMVDESGDVLEGLSSNFFAIMDGEIWTAEEGVLSGITRSLVLDGVKKLKIPLHLNPINLADLPKIQEAFITSSSRAVLPIAKMDEMRFPAAPGQITQKLMQEYSTSVAASLEELYSLTF